MHSILNPTLEVVRYEYSNTVTAKYILEAQGTELENVEER